MNYKSKMLIGLIIYVLSLFFAVYYSNKLYMSYYYNFTYSALSFNVLASLLVIALLPPVATLMFWKNISVKLGKNKFIYDHFDGILIGLFISSIIIVVALSAFILMFTSYSIHNYIIAISFPVLISVFMGIELATVVIISIESNFMPVK